MSSSIKIKEFIFIDNDNTFTIEFRKAGFDFSQTNKVEFKLNDKAVNSTDNAAFFDIVTGPLIVGSGTFIFIMGEAGYLPEDSGEAVITLFGPGTPLGLIFAGSQAPTEVEIVVLED